MTTVQAPAQSTIVPGVLPTRATKYVRDDLVCLLTISRHSCCNKSVSPADCLRATVPARAQQLLQVCGGRDRGGLCGAGSPGVNSSLVSLREAHVSTLYPMRNLGAVCLQLSQRSGTEGTP